MPTRRHALPRRLRPLMVVLAFVAACANSDAAPPPVEAFARGADFDAPSISPDGSAVVYITHTEDGRRLVALRTLRDGVDTVLARGEAGKRDNFLAEYCWFKTDQRIICHLHGTGSDLGLPYRLSRIVALNRDGTESSVLVQDSKAGDTAFQDRIVSRLPSDPTGVLIALDHDLDALPSVFRLDVFTSRLTEVVIQRPPITRWVADPQGAVRFGYGYLRDKAWYVARETADAKWRTLRQSGRSGAGRFEVLGFGQLPHRLLVTRDHGGREAIWELDLRDQSGLELVFAHPEVDVDGADVWPGTGRVIGFAYETDRPQLRIIDPEAASIHAGLEKLLPGKLIRIVDGSRDGRRLIVLSRSDTDSGAYHLLDLDTASLRPLGLRDRALAQAELATMRPVRIPAADGAPMPGYLTLPPGVATLRGLPAVVLPHGGPYSRDSWGYDPLVQVLATRGYAVLQVNYRGSTGYGAAWLGAGFQRWGTVMHDDITAAARWLLAEGVDARRMCIVGWSYGGYAALIGAVKEPDLYRCAASIAGVSDLGAMLTESTRFVGGLAAARESIGKVDFDAESPRRRAAEIKIPVLLVHGGSDERVLASHSVKMANALKRAGLPHDLLILENGAHDLETPAQRLALFTRLVEFLAANLESTTPAATAAAATGTASRSR